VKLSSRTGLAVVTVVGSMLVGMIAGTILFRAASPTKDRPATDPKNYPDGYARTHRWWVEPLTEERLDDLLQVLIDTPSGHTVWIDSQGRYEVVPDKDDGRAQSPFMRQDRKVPVIVNSGKRWNRTKALKELIGSLDWGQQRFGSARVIAE
jgi:hypothetical protein